MKVKSNFKVVYPVAIDKSIKTLIRKDSGSRKSTTYP